MLGKLRDWWQSRDSLFGSTSADSISAIGHMLGQSLVASETEARRIEPGDGSGQIPVVQKLTEALEEAVGALACSSCNPTLFLESPEAKGQGVGITAESDWLRLLAGWRGLAGLGEVYTQWLALAPNSSINLDLTISPVTDGGGYWTFLNGVRRRWAVNGITMERPHFWGHAEDEKIADPQERLAKAMGNLGPVYMIAGSWQRGLPHIRVVAAGQYPKLPPEVPRTVGKSPDFDVETFLTFAHREPYWQQSAKDAELIRKAAPNVKIIGINHPAMECIYKPLQDRWPISEDAIKTPTGETFEDGTHSCI